ncbi:MAG: PH domain-containing protein [Alphaproteobacteria bacterium]
MTVRLREEEYIRHETHIHYAYFIMPFLFACGGGVIIYRALKFMNLYNWWSWKGVTLPIEYVQIPMMIFGAILILPFLHLLIFNRTKEYVITSDKIYIKKGILNTSETEIPLTKINDIEIKANFFERMFNTGDILIFTGNDNTLRVDDVINPYLFKALALNEM